MFYSDITKEQVDQGIMEAVPNDTTVGHVCYLPHHAIVRHDKQTTKVRVVYDGSAIDSGEPFIYQQLLAYSPKLNSQTILYPYQVSLEYHCHNHRYREGISNDWYKSQGRNLLRFLWLKEPGNVNSEVCLFQFSTLVVGLIQQYLSL